MMLKKYSTRTWKIIFEIQLDLGFDSWNIQEIQSYNEVQDMTLQPNNRI
jgi:hypothetical protein